jgi:histidine ammonia-lyase
MATLSQQGADNEGREIGLTPDAWERVRAARGVIDRIVESKEIVYGINTGFGKFATVVIPEEECGHLQENLIRSHAAGVGEPLSLERTRMLLALRINILAKGFSGIRERTLQQLIDAFNNDCLSRVPAKGTVGASGDLAPLSHLALGLMGEGEMWDAQQGGFAPAAEVLARHGLERISLSFKEGLAMINGTQLIGSLASEGVFRATKLLRTADVISALSLEALRGSPRAFMEEVHLARPHNGQMKVAARLRALLHTVQNPSEIYLSHETCNRVQDSYTLRCIPQVHGIVEDTIDFVERIINTELNSATDNPMVFSELNKIISAGNFHGEYPAKACDYLTIAIQELANISERRIERLMNPDLSGLPAFLVPNGGLNSGFMIAHCTAAALTSESKTLCFPASCDTISTSSAKEDHVSMGGWAARKCLEVISNVENVLAIELLCACQALDFLELKTTTPLESVHKLVREHVEMYQKDRYMAPDIEKATELVRRGSIWHAASSFLPEDHADATAFLG